VIAVADRWPRAAALAVAKELCDALAPACDRLVVAGSLRRRKATVGDVEILYVSKREERPVDLFTTAPASLADDVIDDLLRAGVLAKRLSKTGVPAWGPLNKLAIHTASGIPVDLFAATPESWWNYLVCRTGGAESNRRIASLAQRQGLRWNPYGVGFARLADGEIVAVGSEQAVFEAVGLRYEEPWERP